MILLENRKVRFDYEIIDHIEAGIVLEGWEVKSIKAKAAHMKSAWVKIRHGQVFLENFRVSPWRFSQSEQETNKPRRLLLHKKEILKLEQKTQEKSLTVVPYKIYLKKGKIKIEICLVRGKKLHDKKQALKERSLDREAKKMLKNLR